MELKFKKATDELESKSKYIYPFDCAPLDIILGGGILSGKIYEIYGRESSGKSTIALNAVIGFINYWKTKKQECSILWIESEYALDIIRAKYMGCNINKINIFETLITEEGFEASTQFLNDCIAKKIKPFIVWDTIAATQPRDVVKTGETYAGGMALKPRLIRTGLKTLTQKLSEAQSPMLFINQVIAQIGSPVPNAETTPGGRGIKFHASVRLKMKGNKKIKETTPSGDDKILGIIVQAYTEKNKLTLPMQKLDIYIYGETGLDNIETTVQFLKKHKLVKVGGGGWTTLLDVPETVTYGDINQEIKFQSLKKLKHGLLIQFPELEGYMNYLVYKQFAISSPLLKVRLIDKIWEYEKKFYKEHITKLTKEEEKLIEG